MTQYAHTTDLIPRDIPVTWTDPITGRLYSGLRGSTSSAAGRALLASLGWYPVRREPLPAGEDEYGAPYLDIDAGEVVLPAAGSALYTRISRLRAASMDSVQSERDRRVDALTGPPRAKDRALMESIRILDRQLAGATLSEREEVLITTMRSVAAYIDQIDAAQDQIEEAISAAAGADDIDTILAIQTEIPTRPEWP